MKKLFTGLLIIAAGTGAFFLLRKKKEEPSLSRINKEWITGKWKMTKEPADSNDKSHFDFQKDGRLVHFISDSVTTDSAWYEWNKNDELVWKKEQADTAGRIYTVLQLSQDSLKVKGTDSTSMLFTRLK